MAPNLTERLVREEGSAPVELPSDLWKGKRSRPSEHRVRALADYLAGARHVRVGDGPEEWQQEKLDWEEAEWMLRLLRPFLAMDAEVNVAALALRLQGLQDRVPSAAKAAKVLLVALDGAPEFSHACFLKARHNGRHPETKVAKKCGDFYRECYHALSLHGVTPIDQAGAGLPEPGLDARENSRTFEDALAGVLPAGASRLTPVTAAVRLHRALDRYNVELNPTWDERIYARVSIASTWEAAANALPRVGRGQTRVDRGLWEEVTEEERELLFACDVRPG
jgi:hypothetical protein